MRRFFRALSMTALVCCLGCGYHLSSGGYAVGVNLDSIAIPLFSSSSSFLGFEGEFTRIVREEFIKHSKVKIVGKNEAQAVLSGRLHSITTEPKTYTITERTINSFSSTDEVTRKRTLEVKVDVKLTDTRTGKVIWRDPALKDRASFIVSTNTLSTEYNQRRALITVAEDIATRIYARTMERF